MYDPTSIVVSASLWYVEDFSGRTFTLIRPAILYRRECGPLKSTYPQQECRRDADTKTGVLLYKIKNKNIQQKVQVVHIENKTREVRLKRFSYVLDARVHNCGTIMSEGVKKGRGRPKNTRKGVIPKDLQSLVIM